MIAKTKKNVRFGGYTTHVLNGGSVEIRYKDDKAFCFNIEKKNL